jgi:arylsulfatase
LGFGASSAFSAPCQAPTAERLAAKGLKYNRFHTTALLLARPVPRMLSGRNHHAVGMGGITEIATSAPGYNSLRPNTCAPLAEILKLNGYSTAQFGKCHEVPVFESATDRAVPSLANGSGFEHFYGSSAAAKTTSTTRALRRNDAVEPDRTPEEGYHLTEDLGRQGDRLDPAAEGDRARTSRSSSISRPVPATHRTMSRRMDRRSTRASLTRVGTRCAKRLRPPEETRRHPTRVRADTRTRRNPRGGDEERLRPVLAPPDGDLCRVPGACRPSCRPGHRRVRRPEHLDDTLIYYIIGDNGASAEGSLIGAFNDKTAGEAPTSARRSC